MLYRLILMFILAAMLGCEDNNRPVIQDFNENFQKIREINLEPFSVYNIRFLDVSSNKDLLITNRDRDEVFLFDSLGKVKSRLSTEVDEGFPGANWAPYRAYFTANDEIFVSNGVPWGIWFHEDGTFKKMMPKQFKGTPDLAFDKQDNIYSMNKNSHGFYIEKYDSNGQPILKFTEIDSTNRTIMRRTIIGNNILVAKNNLFFKNLSKAKIYKYNLSGRLIDDFLEEPSYYKRPDQDIVSLSETDRRTLSKNIFEFARKYTANYSLHNITEGLILVQYVNMGGNYGLQFLTTEGEYIYRYDLYTNHKIVASKDGLVYTVTENDSTTPKINVFKFKP